MSYSKQTWQTGELITSEKLNHLEEGLYTVSLNGSGLSNEAKAALLNCFAHVAWTNEQGQDYYDALEAALYPPADLVSISAVYTQSGTVYDTDTLDSLKPDLVVTAVYSDSTTEAVTSYTLSGTLAVGTSTITVSYGGKTTTFNVTVTEKTLTYRHIWDFTQSLVDSVGGVEAQISTKASQDSSGLHLNNTQSVCLLGTNVFPPNSVVEVTFVSTTAGTFTAQHGRLLMISDIASPVLSTNAGNGFIYRSTGRWAVYKGSWMDSETTDADVFNGKKLTMKYYYSSADSKYHTDVYADDTLIIAYSNSSKWNTNANADNLFIGSVGQAYYSAVISDVKIYDYEG